MEKFLVNFSDKDPRCLIFNLPSQRSNISITEEEQIIDLNDKEKDLNKDDNSSKNDNAKTENLESLKDIKDKKSDDFNYRKLNFEFIEASNRKKVTLQFYQ